MSKSFLFSNFNSSIVFYIVFIRQFSFLILVPAKQGKLFYSWLYGDESNGAKGSNAKAAGKILLPENMPLSISTEDYLGGLADLSGEIGRFAVALGTVRDKER